MAVHSLAIGIGLVVVPDFATNFAGFGSVRPLFFARQAGAFHVVLATGYLLEARRGAADFVVVAKLLAVLFLGWSVLAGAAPWSVTVSGAADGLMGLGALWLQRRAGRSGAPSPAS